MVIMANIVVLLFLLLIGGSIRIELPSLCELVESSQYHRCTFATELCSHTTTEFQWQQTSWLPESAISV
jgi:hypothetical protein